MKTYILGVLALLIFAGCASVKPIPPEARATNAVIWNSKDCHFTRVDGKSVYKLFGGSEEVLIPPGNHIIETTTVSMPTMGAVADRAYTFTVKPGYAYLIDEKNVMNDRAGVRAFKLGEDGKYNLAGYLYMSGSYGRFHQLGDPELIYDSDPCRLRSSC